MDMNEMKSWLAFGKEKKVIKSSFLIVENNNFSKKKLLLPLRIRLLTFLKKPVESIAQQKKITFINAVHRYVVTSRAKYAKKSAPPPTTI